MTMLKVNIGTVDRNITVFKRIPKASYGYIPLVFRPDGFFQWNDCYIFSDGFKEFTNPPANGYMADCKNTKIKVKGYHCYTTREQAVKESNEGDTIHAFVIPTGTKIYVSENPKGIIASEKLVWMYRSYI
jgi:hypothetical protein